MPPPHNRAKLSISLRYSTSGVSRGTRSEFRANLRGGRGGRIRRRGRGGGVSDRADTSGKIAAILAIAAVANVAYVKARAKTFAVHRGDTSRPVRRWSLLLLRSVARRIPRQGVRFGATLMEWGPQMSRRWGNFALRASTTRYSTRIYASACDNDARPPLLPRRRIRSRPAEIRGHYVTVVFDVIFKDIELSSKASSFFFRKRKRPVRGRNRSR